MKRKNISYFVVGLLLISSFAAIGLGKEANVLQIRKKNSNIQNINLNLEFSAPTVSQINVEGESYVQLEVAGADTSLYNSGKPMMPYYAATYELPFGSKIINVKCTTSEVQTMAIEYNVLPAPQPVPVIADQENNVVEFVMDEAVYGSLESFPTNWFNYYAGGGLNSNGERTTFLTIRVYPVKYVPATDTINYVENIDLTITYQKPVTNPFPAADSYDLVIIAPQKFSNNLQKLVTFKNSKGVETILKTTEDIYSEFSGVDKPEKIKYFIKDALETWNIKYVLLVGGLDSYIYAKPRDDANQGSKDWHVPVRYTNLDEGAGVSDPGFISDLYYADIYDSEGNFSSWDTNGDGIFAKWYGAGRDILDLYPDVYVGRLACANNFEVKIMVNKIINYEKGTDSSWFNKMVVIGGDTFNDTASTNYYEGEVENQKALDDMPGFTPVKVWASNRDTSGLVPIPRDIIKAISQGCGFLAFSGHGSPERWNTYWPEAFDEERAKGLYYYAMPFIHNGGKLPVCVVGGCHNSQFNVTMTGFLLGEPWVYGPVPQCFSWLLARKIGGGTICALGNTGLGYGAVGEHGDLDGDGVNDPDCVEALGGYIESQFFKAYGVDNIDVLGDVWAQAVNTYLTVFPPMSDQLDCKTVEQWPILGDPSLKIGGYPAATGLKANIENMASGIEVDVGQSLEFNGIAFDGQAPYNYAWDLDEDGLYDDATGITASRGWIIPGVYCVSLKVTDGNGKVATYDTIVGVGDWMGIENWFNFEENQNSDLIQGQTQSNPQIIGMQSLIIKSKAKTNNN